MKKTIAVTALLLLFLSSNIHAQESKSTDWFFLKSVTTLKFTKTNTTHKIDDFLFEAIWDEKLRKINDEKYSSGISELKIFRNGNLIQTIENIKDKIGLGYIHFAFYDYNMDGHLDFTVPLNCGKSCYYHYYLFNPTTNNFEYQEQWDYLKVFKLNKVSKQILSVPEGTASEGTQKRYKVEGFKLIEVETIHY